MPTTLQQDVAAGRLTGELEKAFQAALLHPPHDAEVRSWEHGLSALVDLLADTALGHVRVYLEYQLPLTSKRVDVLLVGARPGGGVSVVVVENKQWTVGELEDSEARTVMVAGRRLLHPRQQVAQYVQYLEDFSSLVEEGEMTVEGCAFLHEARRAEARGLAEAAYPDLEAFPLFTREDRDAMRTWLEERLSGDGAEAAAAHFEAQPVRPAKTLLAHVARQVEGEPMFTLLDEQRVAYEEVLRAVSAAQSGEGKTVVVIVGGPGTGKSVIAMDVLAELARQGVNVTHATGSRSFTLTLRHRVGRRAGQVFRYFNNFTQADADAVDVLIADEAHRIRESSNTRFTRKDKRSTTPQVDELVRAAAVPVFLLDERQVVRPYEVGTVAEIEAAADRAGADLVRIDLAGQFRLAGSLKYLAWVDALLGLNGAEPATWDPTGERFELTLVDSPEELEAWVNERAVDGTARMSAGFCWPWSDPDREGHLVADVAVNGWRRPWNAKPEKKVVDAPPADLWASEPDGIGQVGCIYTTQGFEYDYGGVILGPDLVWRDEDWVADASASQDAVVKRAGPRFDELVRHTYKVLLTRGMRGCAIYSTDEETREVLRGLVRD